jgi:hypothetical protein
LLGRYESFVLRLYGTKRFWFVEKHLEKFLSYFPPTIGAEEFTIGDINAYRLWRLEDGIAPKTLDIELRCLKDFFVWMIEDEGLPLFNPVKLRTDPEPPAPNKNRLKLEDFRRLLMEADDNLQDWIVGEVIGEPVRTKLAGPMLQQALHAAAIRAGLPWMNRVGIFRESLNGLWKEIIKRECPRLKDILLEPEPIQHPPLMGPMTEAQVHMLIGGL